jgi:hypothetical protein
MTEASAGNKFGLAPVTHFDQAGLANRLKSDCWRDHRWSPEVPLRVLSHFRHRGVTPPVDMNKASQRPNPVPMQLIEKINFQ